VTLGVLIKFIYTDLVGEKQLTLKLLAAADKYNISVLFNKCERSLCSSINTNNAANYFLTAYLHDASILKQIAMSFIIDNYEQIKGSPGMSLISERHPKALLEILEFSAKVQ
jgi:speckle-type POZ protein